MTLLLLWAEADWTVVVVVIPGHCSYGAGAYGEGPYGVCQSPNNFGAFIDRRERRMERREWLVESGRRGG